MMQHTPRLWILALVCAIGTTIADSRSQGSSGARSEPLVHGDPAIVLIEQSQIVWDDLVSAELPTVIVYGDGYAIFRSAEHGGRWHRRAGFVESGERESMLNDPRLSTTFSSLSSVYDLFPNIDDENVVTICMRISGALRCVSVHGFGVSEELLERLRPDPNGQAPVSVPEDFREAYDLVSSIPLQVTSSRVWAPSAFRVRLSRFGAETNCRRSIVRWPKNWPTLEDARAIDQTGEILELFLDGRERKRVMKLFEKSEANHPVDIGGELFRMWYFPVIPGEEAWSEGVRVY